MNTSNLDVFRAVQDASVRKPAYDQVIDAAQPRTIGSDHAVPKPVKELLVGNDVLLEMSA